MSKFGKPNHKGRASGKHGGKFRDRLRAPKDMPWTWITLELISSDAWRLRSINCVKFIDFLLADHMNNAGQENGRLMATYDQLEDWGMRRANIRGAIDEATFLGLVRQTKQGGRYGKAKEPSEYRLTFFPVIVDIRSVDAPSNEWKGVTEQMILTQKKQIKDLKAAKKKRNEKQFYGTHGGTVMVRTGEPLSPDLKVVK